MTLRVITSWEDRPLSGMGANGSMGIKRVKERGGLVLAQEPAEAEFDEMPRNSITTGLVDQVLRASEMPGRIKVYREQLGGGGFRVRKRAALVGGSLKIESLRAAARPSSCACPSGRSRPGRRTNKESRP